MTEDKFKWLLFSLRRYCSFFLVVSFIVTCCILTFLSLLTHAMSGDVPGCLQLESAGNCWWNAL